MKEITKYRLKQVNRLLKIGLLTFCWLMCAVGVTAYTVYWLRQNANYRIEQYEKPRINKPIDNNREYRIYSLYDLEYYTAEYNASNYDFIEFERNSMVSQNINITLDAYIYNSDIPYDKVTFVLERYQRGSEYQLFKFESILLYSGVDYADLFESSESYIYNVTFMLYYDNVVPVYSSGISYLDALGFLDFAFTKHFDSHNALNFDFNNMANYNKLFSYQLLNNNVFEYNGTNPVTPIDIIYYLNCPFVSNGQFFKGLSFHCSAVAFVSDNNGNVTTYDSLWVSSSDTYKLTLTSITYWYYGSNTGIDVCSLGVLEYKTQYNNQTISSTPVWLTMNGFNWVDEDYKYLSIYEPTKDNVTSVSLNYINASVCPFLSLSSYDALTFNVADNIIGNITDVGLSNVFTLMSSAFTGLAGLMAIQIIPGIILGLLCFIPLIVTIILVVLKLVKK